MQENFSIHKYDFTPKVLDELISNHYANDLWPVVYIINDDNKLEAYIGETTDTFNRMKAHLANSSKSRLTAVSIISSGKFNKSATLDIESNLIKYFSGDGKYKLLNGNLGLANHNYYQKNELYSDMFQDIWNKLRSQWIVRYSLSYINNSDLFKYSPYKSLSKKQFQSFIDIVDWLLGDTTWNIVAEWWAGTGKTILALFLFKMLLSWDDDINPNYLDNLDAESIDKIKRLKAKYPSPKIAIVVPMSSFRETLKKSFKNIKWLNPNMVIGPAELKKHDYDIVMIDEAHRLRRRKVLWAYFGAFDKVNIELKLDKEATELDWALKQSKKAIFFYDPKQSIKPSDIKKEDFINLKNKHDTKIITLHSQFRSLWGEDYVKFIDKMFSGDLDSQTNFESSQYEIYMFDSMEKFTQIIHKRDSEIWLSRIVAGYAWKWISKNDNSLYDIEIDNVKLRWNGQSSDWINSKNALEEVGCIHTTQWYDLNYVWVIFGHEITYNTDTNQIEIISDNYHDKNGKMTVTDSNQLKDYIINIYKTIMLRGIKGTYIYVCDKNLRKYLSNFIKQHESCEVAETKHSWKRLSLSDINPFKNCIPLFNLYASAWDFSTTQNIEDCQWITIPDDIKPSEDLFACKVVWESMNKIIPNDSVCLFRKDRGGSRNGKIVLAEVSNLQDADSGSGYTVKQYESKKIYSDDSWSHSSISLKPLSDDSSYEPLILEDYDSISSFRIVGIFERVL